MNTKCEKCELSISLEEDRIEWYDLLSNQNMLLHRKVLEQQDLIAILRDKLSEKRTSILQQYVTTLTEVDVPLKSDLATKVEELTNIIDVFNCEREACKKIIQKTDQIHAEHVSYLNGQVEHFRESLFGELRKMNTLKKYFSEKLNELMNTNEEILINAVKEERVKINNEVKQRHKSAFSRLKEELARQSMIASKLRNHNKKLYTLVHDRKKDFDENICSKNVEIKELKAAIKRLKEKNENLRTQIKLEVEGCQTDIFDTRKRLLLLLKSWTGKQYQ